MLSLRMAFRNVLRHRARSVVSIGVIAAGCVVTIFVGGYFADTFDKMRESYIHGHTGHVQIHKKGFSVEGRRRPLKMLLEDPKDLVAEIQKIPGVVRVSRRLEFPGVVSTGNTAVSFVGQGVEIELETTPIVGKEVFRRTETQRSMGLLIEKGVGLTSEENQVIVGRGLAKALSVKPGDNLTLMSGTVEGSLNAWDVTVAGVFFSSSKAYDDRFLRLPLELSQQLLRTDSVQNIVVTLNETEDTDRVKARISALAAAGGFDVEVKTWYELNDFYNQTKMMFEKMFLVLKMIIALILILSIYNTVMMSVYERTQEIGTLRALGHRRGRVVLMFLLEGLALGVLGALVGILAGIGVTAVIAKIGILMPPPPGATMEWMSEPLVVRSSIVAAFVLSVLSSVVSSILPSLRAARIEIAGALRQVN